MKGATHHSTCWFYSIGRLTTSKWKLLTQTTKVIIISSSSRTSAKMSIIHLLTYSLHSLHQWSLPSQLHVSLLATSSFVRPACWKAVDWTQWPAVWAPARRYQAVVVDLTYRPLTTDIIAQQWPNMTSNQTGNDSSSIDRPCCNRCNFVNVG